MTKDVLITLAEVLLGADDLPWEYALYIPALTPCWLKDMPVMVLDPEETDDPDEACKNGLKYALTISCLQDVVENARAQECSVNLDILIKALKYYYDKDAFITLN